MKFKFIKIICFFTIFIILVIITNKIALKNIYKIEYNEYIEINANNYGIEKALIYAIIKNESGFNQNAISVSNAKGLMQIMDTTAQEVANKNNIELDNANIFEPGINIKIGVIYISELIDKYKKIELALAAYNAGIGNVDKWISQGIINKEASNIENVPYKETNMYIRKVMRDYKIYKKILK